MNEIDDRIPTRPTLLCRLKDLSDNESWKTFCDTYQGLIHGTAMKAGLTHAEADDAVQNTFRSVMKSLPNFEYDPKKGSFKTWLLNLTRWRILDQIDKRDPHLAGRTGPPETTTRTPTVERQPDPEGPEFEVIWNRDYEINLVQKAAGSVKSKVDSKQYQIFDLLVFKEWPVAKVARFLGVSTGRVYLAKHRVGKLVKKEILRLRDKPI
jgi:RNA polymerase sigma factor (sigma-70 family)